MRKESLGVIAAVSVFVSLLPAMTPAASGKAAVEKTCIQLEHSGSHDKPIGSVQMCQGQGANKKPKRLFHSELENKWGFEFDAAAFARLRALVLHDKDQPPVPAGPLPLGTFTISWREQGKVKDDDYTLDLAKSCPYLDRLARAVPGKEYSEFVHVLGDLKARVNCPSGVSE
jgi:hypothetical protein